ncbi:hypothetical protein THF1C08_50036 [Vibrio jasicida]|nr:hypothetical protein THF1C08_50036 [Vibrio jasicida]
MGTGVRVNHPLPIIQSVFQLFNSVGLLIILKKDILCGVYIIVNSRMLASLM